MENDLNIKFSFSINVFVVILVTIALVISLTGFKFMQGYEPASELTYIQIFSYFTVQANTFMGIVSLVFAIKEYQLLNKKIKEIALKYYILKMVATIAVGLTLFVVFTIFGILSKGGIMPLIRNSNLFFHLVIPLISILNFVILEKTDDIKLKHTFYGLIPTALYEVYYATNLMANMKNGKVSPMYDWYNFAQNGLWSTIAVAPIMLGITYIIALTIWRINSKINEQTI